METVPIETPETVPVEYEAEQATEAVVLIDYTPVILEATFTLSNVILCGALMIVGVLCAFKFWEVKVR